MILLSEKIKSNKWFFRIFTLPSMNNSNTSKTFLERNYRNSVSLAVFSWQTTFFQTFTFHYVDNSLVLILIKYHYTA